MSLPKISIVTPSYNQGKFLEETLISIISQGYPNLELIIIDGNSSDNSLSIIKKYEDDIDYWVSENDNGQSDAINKGFEKCTGDIITFCNSDDLYLPGTFAFISGLWKEWSAYGALVGSFQYIDENSNFIGKPRQAILPNISSPIDLSLGPPGIYRLHQVSTFFTRKELDKVGRYVKEELRFVLDRELLYRIIKSNMIFLVDRPLGCFRLHSNSKSVSQILSFSQEFSQLYLSMCNGITEEDKKRKKMANYHLYRGFIKYSKSIDNRLISFISLIRALLISPKSLFDRAFWSNWRILINRRKVY